MKFNEYYHEIYLPKHSKVWTRRIHFLGVLCTILFIGWCLAGSPLRLLILPLAWLVSYFFAWPSHALIEKNTPAAFTNPLLAKLSDWRMCAEMILWRGI